MDRRNFLNIGFATSATSLPLTRWLASPADVRVPGLTCQRVGATDVAELWEAAEDARRWDSRYGGGDWRTLLSPAA